MSLTSSWPCSSSMGAFAATLVANFKSCEGCDYVNKPKDLPFQSRTVIEFSSSFAARFFALRNLFTLYIYICILLVRPVLILTLSVVVAKAFY